jgi:predicted Zn-dependent peptidase
MSRSNAGQKYVVQNEFAQIYKREGGVGLNAGTGYDETNFYVSLPSNKAELWFAMEAERIKRPVFRQMETERQVILQERKQRLDDDPYGRFRATLQVLLTSSKAYRKQKGTILRMKYSYPGL